MIREGVIAAALTSLMILLFLGSFRSTLIIATSIPLSVLGSIATLWTLGETLNIMTLGGLALAVGILVDEATVTIENINWHLEQGKEVEQAILDGAEQIVTPAFVSLLCICIVFVPMFFLTGVPRFLFVPMAEAVMSAMIWSFILSRTLVPTMALISADEARRARRARACAAADAQSAGAFPARLRKPFRALPQRLSRAFGAWRCATAPCSWSVFLAFMVGSFALAPYLGRDFFPSVDDGRILMHVRAPVSARGSRRPRGNSPKSKRRCAQIIPPERIVETVVDNIGFPISGINMTYNNTGTIGTQDGDIQIGLSEDHRPTADYVRTLREELPAAIPGHDIFLPCRPTSSARSSISARRRRSKCRSAARSSRGTSPTRENLLRQLRHVPGLVDVAHSAVAQRAELRCQCRSHPRAICRHHRARRHQQHGGQSRRVEPGAADFLAQSRTTA